MKRLLPRFLILGLVCMITGPPLAQAATEAEKRAAIIDGLEFLAKNQDANGEWLYTNNGTDACTGAALLAFLEEGYKIGDTVVLNGTDYGDVVGDGVNYLLGSVKQRHISVQTAGNPDVNGNTFGAYWDGGNSGREVYTSGMVMPALTKALKPNLSGIISGGAYAGQTHAVLLQDVVDNYAYGQVDAAYGNYRGGWRYSANNTSSDNSSAQWPPIGMLFAEGEGVASVPQFVKDELKHWVGYIQDKTSSTGTGTHGSSGYTAPINSINNEAKTGGLLAEMVFAKADLGGNPYNLTHADVQAAIAYLDREWKDGPSGTWYGNMSHPYAMWSIYKGLELALGLNDQSALISNFKYTPGGAVGFDNPNHANWNWHDDYCHELFSTQGAGGGWGGYAYWTGDMATAWNVNILLATEIPGGGDVPEPTTLAIWSLLGASGLALARVRRRRKT